MSNCTIDLLPLWLELAQYCRTLDACKLTIQYGGRLEAQFDLAFLVGNLVVDIYRYFVF